MSEHGETLPFLAARLREAERRLAAAESKAQACPIHELSRELSAHRVLIDKVTERVETDEHNWDARLVRIEQKVSELRTWLMGVLATSAGSLLLLILSKLLDKR